MFYFKIMVGVLNALTHVFGFCNETWVEICHVGVMNTSTFLKPFGLFF